MWLAVSLVFGACFSTPWYQVWCHDLSKLTCGQKRPGARFGQRLWEASPFLLLTCPFLSAWESHGPNRCCSSSPGSPVGWEWEIYIFVSPRDYLSGCLLQWNNQVKTSWYKWSFIVLNISVKNKINYIYICWRRKWHPTPVFLPGKSHGQRSLVGYSPWGCKESDTTERLHFTSYIYIWIGFPRWR